MKSTGIADTCLLRPRAGVLHLRRRPLRSERARAATTTSTASRAHWNRGREEKPEPGLQAPLQGRLLPRAARRRSCMNIRNEMMQTMIECGINIEAQHHEVATAGQCEIDMKFDHLVDDGRQGAEVQVHHQERGQEARQDGRPSCPSRSSATTAPACTRTSRCGRAASRCSPAPATPGLSDMALYAIGGLLKHAPAILALHQPDDQQLQAAGARLRGAGQPGLLAAQPLGGHPHPDVQPEPQGQARSSSAAPIRAAIPTWRSPPC